MTTPGDVVPVNDSAAYPAAPLDAPIENLGANNLFQEINERRARVENAELLRHLRCL